MASPGTAPLHVTLDPAPNSGAAATHSLLAAMLRATEKVSDLIFSPGRPPQVEVYGQLIPVQGPGLPVLTADDTRRIASDLIGDNKQAINMLREQGSCDISFGLPGLARFRVNVFIQRGSCAVVMRVIPTKIPEFSTLGLPAQLEDISAFGTALCWSREREVQGSPLPWLRCSTASMKSRPAISSPSKIQLSFCTTTSGPLFTKGSCTAILRTSHWPCGPSGRRRR